MKVIFLTPRELASRWRMSHKTLEKWRYVKKGPPYVKVGKRIRYHLETIENFERMDFSYTEFFRANITAS